MTAQIVIHTTTPSEQCSGPFYKKVSGIKTQVIAERLEIITFARIFFYLEW